MWCPEGFVTLQEIYDVFILDSVEIDLASDRPPPASGGFWIDTGTVSQDEMIGYLNWLMGSLLIIFQDDIRACLPTGAVIRLDHRFTWFFDDDTQHFSLFCFPDDFAGRVKLKKREFLGVDKKRGWVIVDNFTKNLVNIFTGQEESPNFGPVLGAPLCIRESRLPTSLYLLSDWVTKEIVKRVSEESDGRGGAHDALVCLEVAFPNGKEKHTWEEVQDKTGYSRRTILRALRAANRTDWLRT